MLRTIRVINELNLFPGTILNRVLDRLAVASTSIGLTLKYLPHDRMIEKCVKATLFWPLLRIQILDQQHVCKAE